MVIAWQKSEDFDLFKAAVLERLELVIQGERRIKMDKDLLSQAIALPSAGAFRKGQFFDSRGRGDIVAFQKDPAGLEGVVELFKKRSLLGEGKVVQRLKGYDGIEALAA